jgi:hypothetical protein
VVGVLGTRDNKAVSAATVEVVDLAGEEDRAVTIAIVTLEEWGLIADGKMVAVAAIRAVEVVEDIRGVAVDSKEIVEVKPSVTAVEVVVITIVVEVVATDPKKIQKVSMAMSVRIQK